MAVKRGLERLSDCSVRGCQSLAVARGMCFNHAIEFPPTDEELRLFNPRHHIDDRLHKESKEKVDEGSLNGIKAEYARSRLKALEKVDSLYTEGLSYPKIAKLFDTTAHRIRAIRKYEEYTELRAGVVKNILSKKDTGDTTIKDARSILQRYRKTETYSSITETFGITVRTVQRAVNEDKGPSYQTAVNILETQKRLDRKKSKKSKKK